MRHEDARSSSAKVSLAMQKLRILLKNPVLHTG
jgi:hypothetical protein